MQNEKTLSAQTVRHALALLRRLCNFGVNKQLCEGPKFKIELVPVDNEKTEDLSEDQFNRLLIAIDEDLHPHAGPMMKLSLFTGMRRSEMFRLKWDDIKFERKFIYLRDTKGGRTEKIPLNQAAAELLNAIPRTDKNFVFPGRNGQRRDINKQVNRIKMKAGLPKDFRPLHGLRHVYASMLASSGQVDMYTLQKLLTHKSPQMTQRYAHLRDETLKKAANLAGELVSEAMRQKKSEKKNENS
jgi:integrase